MASPAPLNVCSAVAEFSPFAKTGGLADVGAALSSFLHGQGHDVRVIMPRYSSMNLGGLDVVPVDFLQDIEHRVGPHRFVYSIDTVAVPRTGLHIYLLRCDALYERPGVYTDDGDEHLRYLFLSRVAIDMCQRMGFAPDIFHVHDWHTATIPLYLRTVYAWDTLFARTRTVLTIHNIGYQGVFGAHTLGDMGLEGYHHRLHQDDLAAGLINHLKTGVIYADAITTVSPTYAREILSEEYGMGLEGLLRERHDRLVGILNGVDYDEWSPERDPFIPHKFSAGDLSGKRENKVTLMREMGLSVDPERPLLGMVCRMTVQKGIDLMMSVLPSLLANRNMAFVVLGSGEARYERFFAGLQRQFPGRVCFYRGYNNALAHLIEAGADMFAMPSRYEPCGLNQMYSLRYGTVPVVRQTGGLADSVENFDRATGRGTGVVFRDYDQQGFAWAMQRVLALYADPPAWSTLIHNAMAQDFSWSRQGAIYEALFRRLLEI